MNRYIVSTAAVVTLVVSLAAGGAFAAPGKEAKSPHRNNKNFSLPADAVEVTDDVFSLGTRKDPKTGTVVEGIAFVHRKDTQGRKNEGRRPRDGGSSCYAFLSNGARWKNTEGYVMNTGNSHGLTDTFVLGAFGLGIGEWDGQVAFDVFGAGVGTTTVLEADAVAPDGMNEVYFGSIADPGVIAVTSIWGVFGGRSSGRYLAEWDMVFDDTDFVWGDATVNPAVMDFQNIATHEIGHAAGMGHPSNSCTEETMYRFGTEGEIKKRDLYTGDIAGIKALYK